jgi:hypothetical protein
MPDQTNITDFDPATGETTTTLVSSHDRGTKDWAARQDGGEDNVPANPGVPVVTPPTLTSIAPATALVADGAVTVTATGSGFVSGAKIRIDGVDATTTYVSPTSLTTSYDATTAGGKQFTVRNPDGGTSAAKTFTVT